MAMVESDERFSRAADPEERLRRAEERCLEAEQRCFRAERRRFEAERQREQVQQLLAQARRAGLRMGEIVEELKRLVVHLRDVAERREDAPSRVDAQRSPHDGRGVAGADVGAPAAETEGAGGEMVDALSAAIARLRANVQAVDERERPAPGPAPQPAFQQVERAPHKHSMSLIRRWRMRRKQRRS